jgi:hypothetical protein
LRAREGRRMVGCGDDGRGCHGKDKRADGCIGLCGADSLLAQPSVNLSGLFWLEGKCAYRRGNSDGHREWSGVWNVEVETFLSYEYS